MEFGKSDKSKAQNTIEFLFNYIWMIIIIAIVLLVLFELGVFSNPDVVARAPPGSCAVQRPFGAFTVESIGLGGVCQSELPKYVSMFYGKGIWTFNCAKLGTCVGFVPKVAENPICNLTLTSWSYDLGIPYYGSPGLPTDVWFSGGSGAIPSTPSLAGVVSVYNVIPTGGAIDIEYNDSLIRYEVRNSISRNQLFLNGNFKDHWAFAAIEISNGVAYGYMDGQLVTPPSSYLGCIMLTNGTIGSWDNDFHGFVSNVQMYNSSLSQSEIQALYLEGIGGAPIDLQNLMGWWPLNGNTNDYSGNGENGYIYSVSYGSEWTQTYIP